MARVKRGTTANKRRKNLLKYTKGYKWGRKSKYRQAREATLHAWTNMFVDRKKKKRDFRNLWQANISAAVRQKGITYSQFIHALKLKNISLDRRVMSEIAQKRPDIFNKIIEFVK
jgi:large subunit ribosomal protein L20